MRGHDLQKVDPGYSCFPNLRLALQLVLGGGSTHARCPYHGGFIPEQVGVWRAWQIPMPLTSPTITCRRCGEWWQGPLRTG